MKRIAVYVEVEDPARGVRLRATGSVDAAELAALRSLPPEEQRQAGIVVDLESVLEQQGLEEVPEAASPSDWRRS